MGKIGDLFVKLGLKNDDFKQGMQEAKSEVSTFGKTMQSIGTLTKGIWTIIGAKIGKVVFDFMTGSQKLGDAWAVAMSKCKTAFNQFATALTNWDWEGFGQRMRDAMNAAGESTAAHDAEFEVQNALKIRKAAMREELEDLQIIARSTNKSYEERLKAAEDYKTKIKPLYDAEEAMRQSIYLADTKEYLQNAGMANTPDNRDALVQFLTNIAPNGDLVSALEQYSRRNRGAKRYNYTSKMEELINGLGQDYSAGQIGAFATLAEYYQGNNKGDISAQKVTDAITNYFAAAGAFKAETKRMEILRNSFEGKLEESVELGGTEASGNGLMDTMEALANGEAKYAEIMERNAEATRQWTKELEQMDAALQADQEALQGFLDMTQEGILDNLTKQAVDLNELLSGALNSAIQGFSDAMQEMFDQLFTMDNMNGEQIFAALLKPLAETAKKMGEIMLAAGLAESAFVKSLANPVTGAPMLIAAGAALIAIGAAASAALSSLASGGATSATTSTSNSVASATTSSAELTVYVKGTIKGSDILISGQNTQSEWNK